MKPASAGNSAGQIASVKIETGLAIQILFLCMFSALSDSITILIAPG